MESNEKQTKHKVQKKHKILALARQNAGNARESSSNERQGKETKEEEKYGKRWKAWIEEARLLSAGATASASPAENI